MREILARRSFPEMEDLEGLIQSFGATARHQIVDYVQYGEKSYPLHCICLGSPDPKAPAIGFFGGCHGLEKIGSEVILAYMHTLFELMRWDRNFTDRLKHTRLVFMPIVNPVGIVNRTRSNGNGVDLIRNSPLDAEDPGGGFYRGHRMTAKLPYYRGPEGTQEVESKAMHKVVEEHLLQSEVSIAIDVHSGFGAKDRFWFPYAHSRKPFPFLPEAYSLKELFDITYPNHFYAFEPMSRQYTIHGDPWDYFFEHNRKRKDSGFFLPFTLEMGSWNWLKKNPLQIFSKEGVFNPVLPHRRKRMLRRHLNLFDFLHRAVLSPHGWLRQSDEIRAANLKKALELWYES
jgi:hypothetical protein